jgi:hypothetical protein
MTKEISSQDHILQTLKSHEITCSRDTISAAFLDPASSEEITEWARRWLGEETLLEVEELKL